MCGRFTQQRTSAELAELFDAEPLVEDAGGHFNVAPTQDAIVVVEREGQRRVTAYRWGLIPSWAPSPSTGAKLFNARAESVTTSPAFRDAFRRRRCLVPVDAFYEWKRQGSTRQPFAIRRRDGAPLALAGLWAAWRDPATDEWRRSFSIVTSAANELMAELHDRMPVIVEPAAWKLWLEIDGADPGELHGLLGPSASGALEAFPVSRLVNNVRNDGPDLIRPLDPTGDRGQLG